MESEKCNKTRKEPNYKLSERNLDIKTDMNFIDTLLKDEKLDVEPRVRGVFIDIAYTLARDTLVEAGRFAKLANRTNITVEDLGMVQMEETEDMKTFLQTLKNLELTQENLAKPCMEKGLMLPNWRNCQVGAMPELQEPEVKPAPKAPVVVPQGRPPVRRILKVNTVVPVATSGNTGGGEPNVVASTSKGILTLKTTPMVVHLGPSTSANSSPLAKKPRPN